MLLVAPLACQDAGMTDIPGLAVSPRAFALGLVVGILLGISTGYYVASKLSAELAGCEAERHTAEATLEKSMQQTRDAARVARECLDTLDRLHPRMRNP